MVFHSLKLLIATALLVYNHGFILTVIHFLCPMQLYSPGVTRTLNLSIDRVK